MIVYPIGFNLYMLFAHVISWACCKFVRPNCGNLRVAKISHKHVQVRPQCTNCD